MYEGRALRRLQSFPDGYKAYDLDGNELTQIPLGSNGRGRAIIETKTGNATLSGNQSVGYTEVAQGTVTGVGKKADIEQVTRTSNEK